MAFNFKIFKVSIKSSKIKLHDKSVCMHLYMQLYSSKISSRMYSSFTPKFCTFESFNSISFMYWDTLYRIMGIIRGRKVSQISRIWKHSWMFSCAFYLGQNFYIWDCLNRESFLANYGQEGNSQNFSSADDSRYTVYRCSL